MNLSLDTLGAEQFHAITRRGYLQEALDGIDAALAAGFNPVKINAVAVRQLHQDYLAFAKLSIDRPLHVRFIEYMPVGESSGSNGCGWGPDDVISCEELFEISTARRVPKACPSWCPPVSTSRSVGGPRATSSSPVRRAPSVSLVL